MKQRSKKLLGILLSLALMLGLMPGMSLTAYADDDPPYAQYKNTTTVITFDSKLWYLINYDTSTVTLLAKECVGASAYNSSGTFVDYSSNPTVKTAVVNWYNDNITADAKKAVSGNAMFLLTKGEANAITNAEVRKDATAENNGWWLCSPGNDDYKAGFVYGADGYVSGNGHAVSNTLGVRPALKLDLSKVTFDSASNTFAVATPVASVTSGDTTNYSSLDDALSAWTNGSTLTLLADVKTNSQIVVQSKNVTLDLNGFGILYYGNDYMGRNSVITLSSNGNLTLKDGDTTPTNKHYITLDTNGRATNVADTGTAGDSCVEVTGGYLSGGTGNGESSRQGGGVYVGYGCTFTMNGGTIVGNTAQKQSGYNQGGGVYVAYNSSTPGTFIMTGGKITGNKANYGGGVFVQGGSTSFNPGVIKVSGSATISGNTNTATTPAASNVYLQGLNNDKDAKITVADALDSTASIGVTMQTVGVFTSSTNPIKASDYKGRFSSDDGTYFVMTADDELKLGVHEHNFTYSADGATITATCGGSGTCDITEGLALTISAPTGNLVYDGTTTYPAVLSTGYNTTAFPGTYSISYTKDGSAYSGLPKDAGTYTASITAGTGDAAKTASVSYTVTKAAATVTKAPAAKTLTYTGSAQALVDAGTASGGEMQYAIGTATEATDSYTTSIPQKTNVGTYYVWYMAKGDADHSDSEVACVEAKIEKKDAPENAYTVTFDTDCDTVVTAQTVKDGDYATRPDVELVKTGYTFKDWYHADKETPFDFGAYAIHADVTVYALWEENAPPSYYDGVSETYYKITLAESEGGRLTASHATAPKGATVTVTAAPDDGYQAETPAVKDKDGKPVAVTANADGTWSFTIPASDVTVTGSFVREKAPLKFVDVPEDAWYYNDVYWAAENGVALGTDDTHFSPDGDCTRGQFVTFLWRAAGQAAPTGTENPFEDVEPGDYCYEAVLWAVENGITNGVDESHFAPAAPLTRAHAVTFLYRYEQSVGKGFTGLWAFRLDYPDVSDVPDWAYEAFCWMTMEGIVKGSDGKLLPDALCPRCQVVALLARVFAA